MHTKEHRRRRRRSGTAIIILTTGTVDRYLGRQGTSEHPARRRRLPSSSSCLLIHRVGNILPKSSYLSFVLFIYELFQKDVAAKQRANDGQRTVAFDLRPLTDNDLTTPP